MSRPNVVPLPKPSTPRPEREHDPAIMFATEMFEQARSMTDPNVTVVAKRAERAMGRLADAIERAMESDAAQA